MSYTSQTLIQFIHNQGYSDQDIADAVNASRETITRVRLGKPGYQGLAINGALVEIVRRLQQSLANQDVQQKPQVATPKQYSHVVTPVQTKPQVAKVTSPEKKKAATLYEQFYCLGCDRVRPPVRLSREEFIQWARSHPCDWKKQGRCPV